MCKVKKSVVSVKVCVFSLLCLFQSFLRVPTIQTIINSEIVCKFFRRLWSCKNNNRIKKEEENKNIGWCGKAKKMRMRMWLLMLMRVPARTCAGLERFPARASVYAMKGGVREQNACGSVCVSA